MRLSTLPSASAPATSTPRSATSGPPAAGFLTEWPAAKRTRPTYREAATICAAAEEGEQTADAARGAFVDFARDMDILVRADTA